MATLSGHTNLIIGVSLLKGTTVLVSIDESGNVKLWDLKNFNSYQSI
jgi:WD40 repeat protein